MSRILLMVTTSVSATARRCVDARDAAQHLTKHRTGP